MQDVLQVVRGVVRPDYFEFVKELSMKYMAIASLLENPSLLRNRLALSITILPGMVYRSFHRERSR